MVAQWFLALAGLVATANLCVSHEIALPSIFRDHMVLQQGVAVPVWGKADPNTEIIIKFAGQMKATRANTQGDWIVHLDPRHYRDSMNVEMKLCGRFPERLPPGGRLQVSTESQVWQRNG